MAPSSVLNAMPSRMLPLGLCCLSMYGGTLLGEKSSHRQFLSFSRGLLFSSIVMYNLYMTKRFDFVVPGPLVGAVRTTQRAKFVDPNYKRYAAFKNHLRICADLVEVPCELEPRDSVSVEIQASWKKRQRIDLDNVVKSVLDGLWRNDRRVISIVASSKEQTGNEAAKVGIVFHPPGEN